MPNRITNRLVFDATDSQMQDIINKYGNENQFPDFTKIIPPPKDDAYKNLPNQDIASKSPNWWYTWNYNNWGTKWNSYSCIKESNNSFVFETAWSGVKDLMLELSSQLKGIEIEYSFANEDTGSNCASYTLLNGEIIEEFEPNNKSKEAFELAFQLDPGLKEMYILENNNYIYNELG